MKIPSPVHGKFYKRKGGAYSGARGKGRTHKKVGSGRGTYAKRNVKSDRKRRARRSGLRKRYPQHYD